MESTRVQRAAGRPTGALVYLLLVGLPVLALLAVLAHGSGLPVQAGAGAIAEARAPADPLPFSVLRLLTQILVVIAAARLVGKAFRKIRQPQVVGEMAAGILLGPSLFGALWPAGYEAIFPAGSLDFLQALSQVGLLVFMFLVGLELDLGMLRGKGRAAMTISHTSIAVPFALGTLLALWLYPIAAEDGVGFTGFALFLGTAMSVTAFPVLARILTERKLLATPVGAVTIACAAVDDVTAWTILAGVVLLVRSSHFDVPIWLTVAGSLAFVALMIGVVRPLLARRYGRLRGGKLTHDSLGMILAVTLGSAIVTEALGIHALFGAFLAGAVMPRSEGFAGSLDERLQDFTVVLLLPLFFAYTGLRTRIDLLGDAESWVIFLAVMVVAVAGKLGGSAVAARVSGMSWRDSALLGTLMNTRGLMELVVLNLGLEIGIISPRLFAVMVLMALATTFMTSPIVAILRPAPSDPAPARGAGR